MLVFRVRNLHRRYHVLLCFSIAGVIIYHFCGVQPGARTMTRRVGLKANGTQLTLEGKAFRILGGSLHYFRVPRAYWMDRMLKLKACGLNTLTTYVPWNLHEPQRGVFVFQRELDLEAYISMAAEVGLWVILRPGPYISAQWDLGGLPSWLLRDRSMLLRTTYLGFTEAVNSFFDKLIPKVLPLQFKRGGPIIAVQVENEYGSYAKDDTYMPFIKEALLSRGIDELLLTSDTHEGMKQGGVSGALQAINLQKLSHEVTEFLDSSRPGSPKMVMEYRVGWFDVWGDLHHVLGPEDMIATARKILKRGASINIYMFHGGTNFGFMGGASWHQEHKPQVTSYDYDAPLSEAGDYTAKYHLLRDLLGRYQGMPLPDMPVLRGPEAYEAAITYFHLSLWEALPFTEEPFRSESPISMENLPANNGNGQSYGYTLYETTIGDGGVLNSQGNVRDRALVFLDKQFLGMLTYRILELAVPDGKGIRTLTLLVENCGRVSQGEQLDRQHKGLVGDVLLNEVPLKDFTIYILDMKSTFVDSLRWAPWKVPPYTPTFPGFFQGRLFVDGYPSDTYLKLPGWGKGVVFVNGQNLGRHWSVGPQQSLYLPGPWLNSGANEVIVFEEEEADLKVHFESSADLGMAADI
ncbi:beta-galactosidase-1-like protein 2 isoform X2 [Brienomyrus brachyistius]|uniref:beta-galactosidase-1-like protein 2 isoform X2 n=1 Tax=Brienomyrus brachyistius TaxID=42636 RepID=UPI0020B461CA|nr:beta-galactosidase-1-like protein 2 isoform X2 [Brienomyrus brachyistius]